MKRVIVSVVVGLLATVGVYAQSAASASRVAEALPSREVAILISVGQQYGLSEDEQRLLLTIRKIENGGPGVEMGVASDYPDHRAHRHAGDLDRSLRVQAKWAAGTIKKHYSGDLEAFAKRYCPPNWKHWAYMARHWMNMPASTG
jgi:hypothetical protein